MSADGSITNLPDAVAAQGALPMPVVPEPQALSETRLAEIRNRRIDEVTAGPWLVADGEDRRPVVYVELPAGGVRVLFSGAASEADAQFVASARRSVPELLAEVDRLRAEIASLNESLSLAAGALRAKESPSGSYPPALPWAALMDTEDLTEFLDELADAATTNADVATRLAEVERACGTWRLIAEAQHGHNTAPGPDAMTAVFSPVASLREPEGEHYAAVHHSYRLGHDLPETGGAS
jgi:hypothetical protein